MGAMGRGMQGEIKRRGFKAEMSTFTNSTVCEINGAFANHELF